MEPGDDSHGVLAKREQPLVLLAEDDLDIQSLVSYALKADGFGVRVASDGLEALHLYGEIQPDLLILDLMMPRRTGLEVLRELDMSGERHPETPVLVLTARRSEDDVVASFALGAQDYLTKPFLISELRARVRRLLS